MVIAQVNVCGDVFVCVVNLEVILESRMNTFLESSEYLSTTYLCRRVCATRLCIMPSTSKTHGSSTRKKDHRETLSFHDKTMKKKGVPSPLTAEIEKEHVYSSESRGSPYKKKSSQSSQRHSRDGGDGGDGGGSTDDDDDDEDESSSGSSSGSSSEDDENDEEYDNGDDDEDVKPNLTPVKLERSVSTRLRANIDNFIDLTMEGMDDDEVSDPKILRKLVLERLRVRDAKMHAENLFRLADEDFESMTRNITEGMKTAIASELFNRCAKGHSIVLRKELLKDDASRETCIERFFEDNKFGNRLHKMTKSAVKEVMDFADDIDQVRERAFGAFERSGGNYRATPLKQSKSAVDYGSKSPTRGRPRKRHVDEAAEEPEDRPSSSSSQSPKKSKKKRKHSRSRSRDPAMGSQ